MTPEGIGKAIEFILQQWAKNEVEIQALKESVKAVAILLVTATCNLTAMLQIAVNSYQDKKTCLL